jgi:serine/threonine protein kinase
MSSVIKLMVIEADPAWRSLLRQHVGIAWPDAQFSELDPAAAARMSGEFTGADFDLVLLSLEQDRATGLDWIVRHARARPGFPPVIVLAAEGDEALAVRAIKAGAENYLPKERLRHAEFVAVVREALQRHTQRALETQPPPAEAARQVMRGYRHIRDLHVSELSAVTLACNEVSGEQRVFKHFASGGGDRDSTALFDRFLHEYQSIAGLSNPHVVRIFELGVADEHAWIEMEYLAGGTLAARIAQGMTPTEAFSAVRQIARGLSAVHGLGILHCDLKPGNVMLREQGELVLIDFGLAKEMHGQRPVTTPGMIFGTPWYMSPEQGHGGPVDERSDCYSLGVMLFEMLTGRRPFSAPTPMALIYQHRNAPRPRLPEALAQFEPLVHRMMASDPAQRFESAEHVLMALGE